MATLNRLLRFSRHAMWLWIESIQHPFHEVARALAVETMGLLADVQFFAVGILTRKIGGISDEGHGGLVRERVRNQLVGAPRCSFASSQFSLSKALQGSQQPIGLFWAANRDADTVVQPGFSVIACPHLVRLPTTW